MVKTPREALEYLRLASCRYHPKKNHVNTYGELTGKDCLLPNPKVDQALTDLKEMMLEAKPEPLTRVKFVDGEGMYEDKKMEQVAMNAHQQAIDLYADNINKRFEEE